MSDAAINPAAAAGFARGAGDYEKARPSYAPEAIALIARTADLGPARRVLDLAAGTGKLTRQLVPTGADLVAVEPVAEMRATLAELCPGVEILDGTAESIPLPDHSVDAVTVAQAFHWFDAPSALREINRVLKPERTLVLMWNVRDERVPWVKAFTELLVARSGGRPYTPYHSIDETAGEAMTGDFVADIGAAGLFGAVSHAEFANPQRTSPEGVVARAASTSFVAALPEARRVALLDEVRELIATHADTAGRDELVFPHTTWVWWCRTI
ncbi:MAG: methyltransferase domain-containing protein [Actinobacteria bacterium]|nr:methyltransferase domain-containing protein [Actinomycetota bacterium]